MDAQQYNTIIATLVAALGLVGFGIAALAGYYAYQRARRKKPSGPNYVRELTVVRDRMRNDVPGRRIASGHCFEIIIEEPFGAAPLNYKRASIVFEPGADVLRFDYNNGQYPEAAIHADFNEIACARADLIHGTDNKNVCVIRSATNAGGLREDRRPLLPEERALARQIRDTIIAVRTKMSTRSASI